MKIAVTYEDGQVYQHFGHTEQFKIYEINAGQVAGTAVVGTNGSGHGALADMLRKMQVTDLICGGIGGGARTALQEAGVHLYGGVTGDADAAVQALLQENLAYDPAATCDHHAHGEHGDGQHSAHCGQNGCGGHGHCGR